MTGLTVTYYAAGDIFGEFNFVDHVFCTWFIQNCLAKNQGLKSFFQGLLFPNNMK